MPSYKDTSTGKWYCKFNYKDWMGEKKTKFIRFSKERSFDMGERVSSDRAGRYEHGASLKNGYGL